MKALFFKLILIAFAHLAACASAPPPVEAARSLRPTGPSRFVWHNPRVSVDRPVLRVRFKLSPQPGDGLVYGLCAEVRGLAKPYCGGGRCDRSRCPGGGGGEFTYRFFAGAGGRLDLEIRWREALVLERPDPTEGSLELKAYEYDGRLRFFEER